ncbi:MULTISPECIES: YchJ family metal-binding protein [unclassified Cupriavidus]|uniref:YchJ family metal-binding protein n=1 Tax=unclassified Cupriavidus TaxID=2640874 RepID=UPI001366117C|nr:YchJ family metal-binding protein [Cupriavidus sp. SW-Y-13]MWL85939.1 hypothetical protein [Cupriavidus sp. SW-Y-13]
MTKKRAADAAAAACPCGNGPYASCCGRFHRGEAVPATAEALMRSRYSAYVLGDAGWLRQTWHGSTCPEDLSFDNGTRWLGLTVKSHVQQDDTHATVAFVARYKVGGRAHRMEELSRFVFEPREPNTPARWLYIDGELKEQD